MWDQLFSPVVASNGMMVDPRLLAILEQNLQYNPEGDPSLGANVDLGWSGLQDQYGNTGVRHFTPEELARTGGSPYIFPGHGGQGTAYVTTDPNELASWQDDQRTRMQQAAAQIATMIVGGTALTGGFSGGAGAGGGAGGAAADGLSPITVNASRLAGGVPAVDAASAAVWGGGAVPALSQLPSAISTPGAISALTTGAGGAVEAGGGMLENLLGGMRGNWGSLIGGLLGAIDANNQPESMTTNQGGTSRSAYNHMLPETITGPAGEALTALRSLYGRSAGADPATLAAIAGLTGFAEGGGINPYLDSVFNTAADATQNRISSEFARSGRNVGGVDHQGLRSQELQTLAAGIYAPGYESERQRQFSSLIPLMSAGDYMRNLPYQDLSSYLAGLQGLAPFFPGTQVQETEQNGSVTQPLFNNPWAGFLGGAQLGRMFSPGGG